MLDRCALSWFYDNSILFFFEFKKKETENKPSKMPPNATSVVECTGVLNEADAETIDGGLDKNVVELKHANDRKLKLVWRNILIFGYVHLAAVYGAYLMITSARVYTGLFGKYRVKIAIHCIDILSIHLNGINESKAFLSYSSDTKPNMQHNNYLFY